MARVFVSYRRADGVYAVGWLAQRLRELETVPGVQTAFHDAALTAGDNFEEALEREIDDADIVIAVIGPQWLGERGDGPARITDGDDWVVREIATALRKDDTLVIPIRVGGADPPLASQLHPSIADLVKLECKPFSNGVELDVVVERIDRHLARLDELRAMECGLQQPIQVPTLDRLHLLISSAALAAVLGGIAGWLATTYRICPGGADACAFTDAAAAPWLRVLSTVTMAFVAGAFVFGLALVGRLRKVTRYRRRELNVAAIVAIVIAMLAIVSFMGGQFTSPDPPITNPARNWIVIGAAAVLVLPWPLVFNTPAMSDSTVPRVDLRGRALYLGMAQDAERWGAVVLTVTLSLGIAVMAATMHATDEAAAAVGSDLQDQYQPVLLVMFALVISAVMSGAHLYNMSALATLRRELTDDLTELRSEYRAHAEPVLQAPRLDGRSLGFRVLLTMPAATALAIALAVELGS